MQNNKGQATLAGNLIGNEKHKDFLQLQSSYAIGKRGGSILSGLTEEHESRLVSHVNLLSRSEICGIIFSEDLFITAS